MRANGSERHGGGWGVRARLHEINDLAAILRTHPQLHPRRMAALAADQAGRQRQESTRGSMARSRCSMMDASGQDARKGPVVGAASFSQPGLLRVRNELRESLARGATGAAPIRGRRAPSLSCGPPGGHAAGQSQPGCRAPIQVERAIALPWSSRCHGQAWRVAWQHRSPPGWAKPSDHPLGIP